MFLKPNVKSYEAMPSPTNFRPPVHRRHSTKSTNVCHAPLRAIDSDCSMPSHCIPAIGHRRQTTVARLGRPHATGANRPMRSRVRCVNASALRSACPTPLGAPAIHAAKPKHHLQYPAKKRVQTKHEMRRWRPWVWANCCWGCAGLSVHVRAKPMVACEGVDGFSCRAFGMRRGPVSLTQLKFQCLGRTDVHKGNHSPLNEIRQGAVRHDAHRIPTPIGGHRGL